MCFTKRREFIFFFPSFNPRWRERESIPSSPPEKSSFLLYTDTFSSSSFSSLLLYIFQFNGYLGQSHTCGQGLVKETLLDILGVSLSPEEKKMHASRNLFPPQVDSLHDITRHTHTKNTKKKNLERKCRQPLNSHSRCNK